MPARYDLTIEQGTTFRRVVDYRDASGGPFDLTGWEARLQVRQVKPRGSVVTELTTAAGETVSLEPVEGRVVVTLSSELTASMPAGNYAYHLDLVAPAGDVIRILRGVVTVRRH